jgi:hypothetical protein
MQVAFMPLGQAPGGETILIRQFPVILARPAQAPLTPEACTVSPYHCRIDVENGVLVVRDLGSKYGTFVNESRVREACLWPGSKLTVGLNSYFVCYSLPERGVPTGTVGEKGTPHETEKPAPRFSARRAGTGIDIIDASPLNESRR